MPVWVDNLGIAPCAPRETGLCGGLTVNTSLLSMSLNPVILKTLGMSSHSHTNSHMHTHIQICIHAHAIHRYMQMHTQKCTHIYLVPK